MPVLTIDALRKNPWNILSHELPQHPPRALLRLALLAADYCRRSESMLSALARDGEYTPAWWQPGNVQPDAHEESEHCAHMADCRFEEISGLLEVEYGGAVDDR